MNDSPNPFAPPRAFEAPPAQAGGDWILRYRRLALGLVFAAALADGFLRPVNSPARVLVALMMASSIAQCCLLDARLHGKVFLRSFGWALMVTWPVGVAVHLIWTRGAKGLLTYVVLGCASVTTYAVGFVAARFVLSR